MKVRNCPVSNVQVVTAEEVCVIASSIATNKCLKVDGVPNEVCKYCNEGVYEVLASVLTHSFVPTSLTDVVLTAILKNILKEPIVSTNYRTIYVASARSDYWKI